MNSDPNQNPFAAWAAYNQQSAPAAPAPATYAPPPAAPASYSAPATATVAPAADSATPNFGGPSLEWGGNDSDPSAKTVRLRDRLKEADVERRKDEEAADQRERAAEIRREIRLKKIKYLEDMPDSQPAGTGT